MLRVDPGVAATRDGFGLTPMQWAVDYENIARQHGLARPNPATLLALLPAIVELVPPGLEAGEVCLRAAPDGWCRAAEEPPAAAAAAAGGSSAARHQPSGAALRQTSPASKPGGTSSTMAGKSASSVAGFGRARPCCLAMFS
mmetsp:Transcript_50460/g.156102  ORF Transcript_50460/g.156102 Transcript_50460/m.156102 type:complete len:142 (-) Transcript_50460:314-739(-)